ncbi:MAG TPA: hypothetical protein VLY24_15040 [Bryobacteraceae bacterium]|nr:hypothetical protein [Bryobacteraceae bacterium]
MVASRTFLIVGALFAFIFASAVPAQTISVAQGNGQLDCDGCATGSYSFFDELVVLVQDASGNPVSNATVNWSVTDADLIQPPRGVLISGATTVTGSTAAGATVNLCNQTGYSCNRYNGSDTGGLTLRVMAVTATLTNGQSVTFTLTETPNASSSGATESNAKVQVTAPQPNSTTTFQGTANTTETSTPITVNVQTNGGLPIPNVSVRLIPDPGNSAGSPTASCATGTGADPQSVLTDSTGNATCDVAFGSIPSSGTPPQPVYFWVLIGGVPATLAGNPLVLGLGNAVGYAAPFNGRYALIVTPSTANAVQIVSGNFQSANSGQAIPLPLVVQVVDASTPPNPLPSTPITWSVTPTGSAVITPSGTATGSNGRASATVVLSPNAAGLVQVTASTANGKTATFSLTATIVVTVTSLKPVSSTNNQSVPEGSTFQPISVQLTTGTGQTLANVPVQFTVTSGPASLNGTNPATTGATGLAAIGVNAGTTAGSVVITATAGGQTATFNLTVTPPGITLTNTNFVNGAGFFQSDTTGTFSALSPCSVGTLVIGPTLTPATLPAMPNLFPAPLQQPSGVSIVFNPLTTKESAPILNVTGLNSAQTLITFQVPCDNTLNGTIPVSVTVNNASTLQPVGVVVREASLGIFEIPMSDGVRRALLIHQDGTIVSLEQPARPNEMVRMIVTGIGPTSPPLATGALPQPGVDSISTAYFKAVAIGTQGGIPVVSEKASPDFIGAYEITFVVPANAATNNNTVLEIGVIVNTGESMVFGQPSGSKIPIQQ